MEQQESFIPPEHYSQKVAEILRNPDITTREKKILTSIIDALSTTTDNRTAVTEPVGATPESVVFPAQHTIATSIHATTQTGVTEHHESKEVDIEQAIISSWNKIRASHPEKLGEEFIDLLLQDIADSGVTLPEDNRKLIPYSTVLAIKTLAPVRENEPPREGTFLIPIPVAQRRMAGHSFNGSYDKRLPNGELTYVDAMTTYSSIKSLEGLARSWIPFAELIAPAGLDKNAGSFNKKSGILVLK